MDVNRTQLTEALRAVGLGEAAVDRVVSVVEQLGMHSGRRDPVVLAQGRRRESAKNGGGAERRKTLDQKIQTKFDTATRQDIEDLSQYFGVPASEVIRTAFRVYAWARQQVAKGMDVGAYDSERGMFIAYDIPYATPPVGTVADGR